MLEMWRSDAGTRATTSAMIEAMKKMPGTKDIVDLLKNLWTWNVYKDLSIDAQMDAVKDEATDIHMVDNKARMSTVHLW